MSMYSRVPVLMRYIREYEHGDERFRKEIFPDLVRLVLNSLRLSHVAERIKNDRDAYLVAKKIVTDYMSLENDPVVSLLNIRRHLVQNM